MIAALAGDEAELVGEAADLLFHLLVLLAEKGVALEQVFAELDRREGTSGLAEKSCTEPKGIDSCPIDPTLALR